MQKQLIIYAALISAFIIYNQFFQVPDGRLNDIINIIFSSILFLYIAYLGFLALKKIRNISKK